MNAGWGGQQQNPWYHDPHQNRRRRRGWFRRNPNRPRRRRRDRADDASEGCDSCDSDCSPGCDCLMVLSVGMVLRVLLGALLPSARAPYGVHGLGRRLGARVVRSYQVNVTSPRYRAVCRMEPHCSAYGLEAVTRHGLVRGGVLTARRLRRCNKPAGLDPVPG